MTFEPELGFNPAESRWDFAALGSRSFVFHVGIMMLILQRRCRNSAHVQRASCTASARGRHPVHQGLLLQHGVHLVTHLYLQMPSSMEAEWPQVIGTKATLERKRKDCFQCPPMGLLNQSWPLSPTCAVAG